MNMIKNIKETNKLHDTLRPIGKLIFVFGSNEAGVHGAGAARLAQQRYGAVYGKGFGLHGVSFAIPTKNRVIRTLPLVHIDLYVQQFKKLAASKPDLHFQVTQIGCGLAGYTARDIAPMFRDSPKNCSFDTAWHPFLGDDVMYWGTVP